MRSSVGPAGTFILAWIFAMLLLVFVLQARDYYGPNPILRQRLRVQEGFQSGGATGEPVGEDLRAGLAPGAPELNAPRAPYSLLKDWLPVREEPPAYPTAERCRAVDFQTRLEKTGNFRQLTNNYKRGDPDSCSAPIEDMTMAFYRTEPVAQFGCISPAVE